MRRSMIGFTCAGPPPDFIRTFEGRTAVPREKKSTRQNVAHGSLDFHRFLPERMIRDSIDDMGRNVTETAGAG